ncbi:MAG: ferrous iron transporter B, partial [Gemmatimonadetes bacterium]|nr:ferrous iron transporter B [Gemmatimonadota bacterium]
LALDGEADVRVHVGDAKNLARTLPRTVQLMELGRPLVLALNMMVVAERLAVRIDHRLLEERLGFEVVPIVAITGRGIDALGAAIARARQARAPRLPVYHDGVGEAIACTRAALAGVYPVAPEAIVALAIQGDADALARLARGERDGDRVAALLAAAGRHLRSPAVYRVAYERRRVAVELLADACGTPAAGRSRLADRLGRLLARPATGIPALLLVLYLGLYQFVGRMGAGTLVDLIETRLFEARLNPWLEQVFAAVPWAWLRQLFVGDYGVLTLGLRYAVAIILPVVGSFFLFFSLLEDSGYFPRLALLVDRGFKRIGLSGRAVIPMVLGFACDTMATMVTRTLETRRERVLATLLLALAIPCSAQLGVMLALLSGSPLALGVWVATLLATFALVGALAARVLPGEAPSFHMELPPLRLPRAGNVLLKTYTRMHWYFLEVLPLFLFASVLLWFGQLTGGLPVVIRARGPVGGWLGLPADSAAVFLLGFFRRDYGAAGLFDLSRQGLLDTVQITTAAVTLTLFVPCVAQFLMMLKERGWKTALGMFAFITPFAFGTGWLVKVLMRAVLS